MNTFIYERLKNKPGIWRVDGTSSVRDKGRLGTAVNLHFSSVEVGVDSAYKALPKPQTRPLTLSVHTATLSKFKVGSIWKDGELYHSPQIHNKHLTIDVSRCRLFRLNETVDLDGVNIESVIPISYFDFGENRQFLSDSFYALVPVVGDPQTKWLVAPCSEILRFYYGQSARLLANTLRGQIDSYISWDYRQLEDGHCVIRALKPISKPEAAVLARAIVDPFAKSAMLSAHRYLSATNSDSTIEKKSLVIKSEFPFKDRTTLQVAGKRMLMTEATDGKEAQWGIFAMDIIRCFHPLGFSSLTIEEEQIPYQGASNPQGPARPPTQRPRFDPLVELPVIDRGANKNLKRHVLLTFSNPYAALDNMRFNHVYLREGQSYRKSKATDVDVDTSSMGDGTSAEEAEKTLGLDAQNQTTSQVDSGLKVFLQMIEQLRMLGGDATFAFKVNTRKLKNYISMGDELVAMFPSEMESSRTWHLVDEGTNGKRPRQVVIAEIVSGSTFFYVLEMELKPDESSNYCTLLVAGKYSEMLDDQTFDTLFKLTAIRKRWVISDKQYQWKRAHHKTLNEKLMNQVNLHRFLHTSTLKANPQLWAEAMLLKIRDILH